MKCDYRKRMLIREIEIRADIMEKYLKNGAQFYNEICKRNNVSSLEEMTTAQLVKEMSYINGESDASGRKKKGETT